MEAQPRIITIHEANNGFVVSDNIDGEIFVSENGVDDARAIDVKKLFELLWVQYFYESKHESRIVIQAIGAGGEVLE